MLERMRYLVTGGAGFIGSHLTEELLAGGQSVTVLDNVSTGELSNLAAAREHANFTFVMGSVLDSSLVDDLVEQCDVVVHLAAAVGVKLIVEQPYRSLRTNIQGAENVFDAAHRFRKQVLVASTSEIYGKNSGKLHETADRVLGPTSVARWAYSTSKAVDEVLAFAYYRERRIPTTVVRFFNTVGPRQTGQYGMVVPRFVSQALRGEPLTVYGDGHQTRCFCYVGDVVRALVDLLEHPEAYGKVFNIGGTEEVSIAELAERVIDIAGSESKLRYVDYEEAYEEGFEDMRRRVPDITRARDLVGFEPSVALDEVIRMVVQEQRR